MDNSSDSPRDKKSAQEDVSAGSKPQKRRIKFRPKKKFKLDLDKTVNDKNGYATEPNPRIAPGNPSQELAETIDLAPPDLPPPRSPPPRSPSRRAIGGHH